MTGKEIREKFLQFFAERGHQILPSSSLIPASDPSILWTAAGMVPFKPYFTKTARPDTLRIATCQKCLRTPDIDSVGKTARHHTFFEMLGNFSFGDYFKNEAIPWAWEFVTRDLGFPKERLWVSIYKDDDEAFEIWSQITGLSTKRITRLGKETNFWEIGVGPCGPCSEIYIDLGEERGCGLPDCGVGCDCDRFLEIWNLVFIQYFRDDEGNYSLLTNKGIDTGMGLERVAAVLQGGQSNFDTDLFRGIINFTAEKANTEYGLNQKTDLALKVIADHCRAITFAIADGALPSNEGRGYVLRRLLRRAVRFGQLLGIREPFLYQVAGVVVWEMGDVYPELKMREEQVQRLILTEEKRFGETLNQGNEILGHLIQEAIEEGKQVLKGEDAFRLYDTYGFPLELTQEITAENNLLVDLDGFKKAMEEQRHRARNARQQTEYLSEQEALYRDIREKVGETIFMGYDSLNVQARVITLLQGGRSIEFAEAGEEIEFILDVTPCYAEAGGQVSDYATVLGLEQEVEVFEVKKPVENIFLHYGKVLSGILRVHDSVQVKVDAERRQAICRNHSATHLLHKALKEVLGEHVAQAGSLVEPERLRFDFTHYALVSSEELKKVEELVNRSILANLKVETLETTLEEGKRMGAAALFGEKYGERVRMVKMGDLSLELCGGTHVRATGEIGVFKLVSEGSIGSGVRRVEAVTGWAALQYLSGIDMQLFEISQLVKAGQTEVVCRVETLVNSLKEMEKENGALRAKLAGYEVQKLLDQVQNLNGIKVLTARTMALDIDSLRGLVDELRDRMGSSAVIFLGNAVCGKVNLVASVTRDLVARGFHAGKLVKEVAPLVGGGGGGRPEMAQAGGKDPGCLQEALQEAYRVIEKRCRKNS